MVASENSFHIAGYRHNRWQGINVDVAYMQARHGVTALQAHA